MWAFGKGVVRTEASYVPTERVLRQKREVHWNFRCKAAWWRKHDVSSRLGS